MLVILQIRVQSSVAKDQHDTLIQEGSIPSGRTGEYAPRPSPGVNDLYPGISVLAEPGNALLCKGS